MWKKLLAKYYRLKYKFSKECCYHEMELRDFASGKRCGGLMGGDRFTDYLSYSCVDCPYLDLSYGKCKR